MGMKMKTEMNIKSWMMLQMNQFFSWTQITITIHCLQQLKRCET